MLKGRVLWGRRIMWGIVGVLWFLWIGFEDRSLMPVLILAALISLAIGFEWAVRSWGRDWHLVYLLSSSLKGLTIGGLAPLIAIVLVFLKTSLHQHETPDFSEQDLLLLLQRIPFWASAGFLFGLAYAIWGWAENRLQW
jgi:hypothetical protein